MDQTSLLRLPYIMPAQAQKHVTHNEALRILDAIIHIAIMDRRSTPPDDPAEGQRHIIGPDATDAFAGHEEAIAMFRDEAWAFHMPLPGWTAWDMAAGHLLIWQGEEWISPAEPLETLARLGINAAADDTNRLALAADATLLTHDGSGHQLKINKAGAGDTASLLFQTGWQGHAEMGLAGNNDFSIKTSPDGNTWKTALIARASTGAVSISTLGIGTETPLLPFHVADRGAFGDSVNQARLTSGVWPSGSTRAFSLIDTNAVMRIWRRANEAATSIELASGATSDNITAEGIWWWDMYLNYLPERFAIRRRTANTNQNVFTIDAEGRIANGTTSPEPSSALDLRSTNRGFLPPRMNEAQRDAIASPASGLMIYNTTAKEPQFWNGSSWRSMAAPPTP